MAMASLVPPRTGRSHVLAYRVQREAHNNVAHCKVRLARNGHHRQQHCCKSRTWKSSMCWRQSVWWFGPEAVGTPRPWNAAHVEVHYIEEGQLELVLRVRQISSFAVARIGHAVCMGMKLKDTCFDDVPRYADYLVGILGLGAWRQRLELGLNQREEYSTKH